MTAREHLRLYAGIKGVPIEEVDQLIEERLSAMKLLKVQHNLSKTFSGGMKRRLSVAIGTIGNPKIVFLDEPTTGMDPANRRHVWSFLETFKKGRVMILTTHSMEEADILGDEIAIMALGRVRAFGTSVHLKSKFGAGYRISLVTEASQTEAIKYFVLNKVNGSSVEDDSAGALTFRVPYLAMIALPELFQILEEKALPGVREWGISQSTLEEVFLKIVRQINPTQNK